jgi:hypothetical protein
MPPGWRRSPTRCPHADPQPPTHFDLTRHLDSVLDLAVANPEIPNLTEWAARYLLKNGPGDLDLVVVVQADPVGAVEVLGNAWLNALRSALALEPGAREEVEALVKLIAYGAEVELYGLVVSAALDELETAW